MLTDRLLLRNEIEQIWLLDRSEVIDNVYYLENGTLVLKPEHYDMRGWPPGEAEEYTPILVDCFDRGGWFCGVFDDGQLVGVAVLEAKFIGEHKDQLQLKFLHVSRSHRGRGIGKSLFAKSAHKARELGARQLYISATPSEHTIDFYLRCGCKPAGHIDPDLYALEPEDIHMEYDIPA